MSAAGFLVLYSVSMQVVGVGLLFIVAGTNNRSRMVGLLLLMGAGLAAFFTGHPLARMLP